MRQTRVADLGQTYDLEALRADLRRAEDAEWTGLHAGRGHRRWQGIGLIVADDTEADKTEADDSESAPNLNASGPRDPSRYSATETLAACPYFQEILDFFPCAKRRVRLMQLKSGGRVAEHVDRGYGWGRHTVRLHVPIVTHPEVRLTVAGEAFHLSAGRLWYFETTLPHAVMNDSPIDRVHLVIDLFVDPWLEDFLVSRGGLAPWPAAAPPPAES